MGVTSTHPLGTTLQQYNNGNVSIKCGVQFLFKLISKRLIGLTGKN